MLYIFDLGNVIIDIDFSRVIGVWSNLSGVPLSTLSERFKMGESFERHERGEISDYDFAQRICDELEVGLSFEQFTAGWQAIFVEPCKETLSIIENLRSQGERVVMLSNTNHLHCLWLESQHPQIMTSVDKLYLSQQVGMRKPEERIYQHVLNEENVSPSEVVFFDDNLENINAAKLLGINAILVEDGHTISNYFVEKFIDR